MYLLFKRFVDIIVGLILLVILLPISIPLIIALRLTGEGYVFYKQARVGFRNESFDIWKFATMLKDSPNMKGGSITVRNDPRVTPLGGFLRKSKINELPQLINLLNGTMTLVGPRPHMRVDFECYPDHVQEKIFDIKPGITGIGSIVFRDQELLFTNAGKDPHVYYKEAIAPYKGELELWYQKNLSFKLDFKILFLTAWVIFFPNSELSENYFEDLPERTF